MTFPSKMLRIIWKHITMAFATMLVIALSLGMGYTVEHQQYPLQAYHRNGNSIWKAPGKICQRITIWYPSDFEKLEGCSVIEGSLQIQMIFNFNSEPLSKNLSFPELREITGFFMAFSSPGIYTFRNLFPNLAVIRGQEIVESYALLVYRMPDLQEIGLPSLTNIIRGGVWIVNNDNLCYIETIEWGKVANESSIAEGIFTNKEQCPNACPNCPKSDIFTGHRCWGKDTCQIVPCQHCNGRPCYRDGSRQECCHSQCLGGCTGPGPDQCFVCKGVVVTSSKPGAPPICSDKCPFGLYEYLHRRCVSAPECLSLTANASINHPTNPEGIFRGKWYTDDQGTQLCVLECPKNSELAPNGTACVTCKGTCKKSCPGRIVDSIEAARELHGCTRITTPLKIHIRRTTKSAYKVIVQELKENLEKIEEIDHYLAITYTFSIYSLDFLPNLRVIRGQVLEDKKYALVVKSNDNLMELWNGTSNMKRKIIIENKNASVLFHYNPKLCQNKIWEFVHQSGIKPPAGDNIDVGITNGDKATCNTKTLEVQIRQRSNSSINIRWENFRRNLTLPSHLLNYEIHYKEAPGYPKRNESKFEDRDPCGDDGWNVQEQAKLSDNEVPKGLTDEPPWENEALIANLKPFTTYALYVKAIVIQDTHALNNNSGAESDIIYFRTFADLPTKPQHFRLASTGPNTVTASWNPPAIANGELQSFLIWVKVVPERQALQDQRDYCKDGPSVPTAGISATDSFISTTLAPLHSPSSKDSDCCSCSAPPPKKGSQEEEASRVYAETSMLDIVMGNYIFTRSAPDQPQGMSPTLKPEEDPESNAIRKSRRRRWAQNSSSTSHEDPDPLVFPETDSASHKNQDTDVTVHQMIPWMKEYKYWAEVPYNSSLPKYLFVLNNLTHYTTYHVAIQACRKLDKDIGDNDSRNCSDPLNERVKTAKSETADYVDPKSVSINVTDKNTFHIRWDEPPHPNGVVLGYDIVIETEGFRDKKCVTHEEFRKQGNNYTWPKYLSPGNYSIRIHVASLAFKSELAPAAVQYFIIRDVNKSSPGFWAMVILLPLFLIFGAAGCFAYWVVKKHYGPGQLVISANPEYMANVDIAEEWEVTRDKVKLLKELGQGSFGTVYHGKLMDFIKGEPEVLCAVKTVSDDTPGEDRALFLKEAALMTKLDCHHVVKLLGIVSKSQPIFVIMEFMENKDLKLYLRSRRPDPERKDTPPPPTLKQILRMAGEIADGMSYIHSQRLVHRDLAARNCLVHTDMTVKVGDFGMTKEITDYYRKQTRGLLPVRWMAPESLRDGVFTSQSDVWSFGVVLWEMSTLAYQPYQGLSNAQVLEFVQSGRVMDPPDRCPSILYEMMTGCWRYDHRVRTTFIEILDRLNTYLEPSFAQVSFYHSPEGVNYRTQAPLRPSEEELVTIHTPLIATLENYSDDDDYDTDDDHPGLNHHIVDDLGDTSSRRLLGSTPPKPLIEAGTSPGNRAASLQNGVASSPPSVSGNNNGSNVRNGSSKKYPSLNPAAASTTSQSQSQPVSLFSNPPLLTRPLAPPTSLTSSPPQTSTNSNNNYTEAVFSTPNCVPSSNYSIPLTPVKVNSDKSATNKTGNSANRSPVTYTALTPMNQTLSQNTKNSVGGNNDSTSKSFNSVNCSGDSHKFANGAGTGGNGYILPITGNQRNNKTTQF